MNYSYPVYSTDPYNNVATNVNDVMPMDDTTAVIILSVSLVVALLAFFLIVNGFLSWLREYLNFRAIIIDDLIKFFYILSSVSLTITAFWMMFQKVNYAPLVGLAVLVFGNLMVRVIYEFVMMLVGIWTNTTDIRDKVCNSEKVARLEIKKTVTTKKDAEEPKKD